MSPIYGTENSEYISGTPFADTIFGRGGNDTIEGFAGIDAMYGGSGRDTVRYMYSDDGFRIDLLSNQTVNLIDGGTEVIHSFENVLGSQGNDRIYGDNSNNNLEGENGNDRIYGRGGNDTLQGENGNDSLFGGAGNDRLIGSVGVDYLRGDEGSDRFEFRSTNESYATSEFGWFDTIAGFDGAGPILALPGASVYNDVIDVSQIDANTHISGNQAFTFLGDLPSSQTVTTPGSLWVAEVSGGRTMLYGNTDTNATREFVVEIVDGSTPASSYWSPDFIL
jgi:Ca2+-binding RTX toxin-like protein